MSLQADLVNSYENVWDNDLEGNFWNERTQSDANKDGLDDNPYTVNGNDSDRYPLIGTFHSYEVSSEKDSYVTVVTNSSILSFSLDNQNRTIKLTVDGSNDTYGFCRMSIPKNLVGPNVEVIIDGGLTQVLYANYSLYSDSSNNWIYFAFPHSSHDIIIVPESWLPTLYLALMSSTALYPLIRKARRALRMRENSRG
jgi:hypothetical protein